MNFISDALRDGEEAIKLYDLHGTLKEMADEYERLKKELIHSDLLSADYIESCDSTQLSLQIKKLEEVLKTPEKSGADVVPGLINVHIELYLAYRWRALLATKTLKKNDVPAFVSSDSMNMEVSAINQKYLHLVEVFIERGGDNGSSGGNLLKVYKRLQKETDAATRLSNSIKQDRFLQDGIREIIPKFIGKT